MERRTLIKLLLSTALAESVDFEKLLWVPKPMITVPAMPSLTTLAGEYRGVLWQTYPFWRSVLNPEEVNVLAQDIIDSAITRHEHDRLHRVFVRLGCPDSGDTLTPNGEAILFTPDTFSRLRKTFHPR
jgi:hypothetical protein